MTLLADRRYEHARSQAPAWERTVWRFLPPESLIAALLSAGRACNSLGSQAGAWEPDTGHRRDVSKLFLILDRWRSLRIGFLSCFVFHGLALSLMAIESKPTSIPGEGVESNRWLIVLCGLPGDSGHRERLTDAVQKIAGASQSVFQVAPDRIRFLAGDETMVGELGAAISNPGICDRESVPQLFQSLGEEIQPQDSCWIILLGHAQLYSGRSTFNVKGLDFDATAFSKWLTPIQCRERVIMLTMPVSGFWLKPLRAPNTV